jgi:threonyl-tRNA synthetase
MSQISLTFPDGNSRSYEAGVTPAEVAASIATSLAKKAISAQVNGKHWDLQWPISEDATIAINTMKDEAPALELVRHDLAHIMARAVQEIWPDVKVTIGPVIENGWYYDFDRSEPFTPEDLGAIEKKMREIINRRDPITTEVWDRARAVKFYEANNEPYKVELIDAIPGDEPLRMYWHGHWQDLCRGPHLQNTGQVPADAFKLMSVAGAYWRGDSNRAQLQRIYGALRRPPNAITASWARKWSSSICRKRRPGRSSGIRTAGPSTPNFRTICAASSRAAAMSRSTRRRSSIATFGKSRATGPTIRKICSSSKLTRNTPAKRRSMR